MSWKMKAAAATARSSFGPSFLPSPRCNARGFAAALNLICKAANADSALGRTDELPLGVKSICWDLEGAFTMNAKALLDDAGLVREELHFPILLVIV